MDEAKTTPLLKRKQSQPTLTSHMHMYLPFELVVEILCRLPVKHLIQFSCVCKSWNSLISGDSNFAKKHLLLSTFRHDRHHLMMTSVHDSINEFVLCLSSISSIFDSTATTRFSYSLKGIHDIINASTCDRIICFGIEESIALLCNPSTRKFQILPPLNFLDQTYVEILYTLVYDRFINSYKVLALNHLLSDFSSKREVNVHTLDTNYWERIRDFPCLNVTPMHVTRIFVNDYVHWLTLDNDGYAWSIISLDLEKKSYQKLLLQVCDVITWDMTLGTLRGCLSLIHMEEKSCDIWIVCPSFTWRKSLVIFGL